MQSPSSPQRKGEQVAEVQHTSSVQKLVWHSSLLVHSPPGSVRQVLVVPATQVPAWQESPPVQASPSSQAVPSGAGSSVGHSRSTPLHSSAASQMLAADLHSVPLGAGEHVPLAGAPVCVLHT